METVAGQPAAIPSVSSRITPGDRMAAALVGCLGLVDWLWNLHARLRFAGWQGILGAVCLLLMLRLIYSTVRRNAPIAEMALYAGLWILFTAIGAIQTYLGAALTEPLVDGAYTRADAWLGFVWLDWVRFVQARPFFGLALGIAYNSLMVQIVGSIILFATLRDGRRNAGLLVSVMVALCLTTVVFSLLPALGPCVAAGRSASFIYLEPLQALRHGGRGTFELAHMQGIVSFPSFHATLAVLVVMAHRGVRWSFPLVTGVNLLMLVSIPSIGGHYLTDIFGGIATAVIALLVTHRLPIQPSFELA